MLSEGPSFSTIELTPFGPSALLEKLNLIRDISGGGNRCASQLTIVLLIPWHGMTNGAIMTLTYRKKGSQFNGRSRGGTGPTGDAPEGGASGSAAVAAGSSIAGTNPDFGGGVMGSQPRIVRLIFISYSMRSCI